MQTIGQNVEHPKNHGIYNVKQCFGISTNIFDKFGQNVEHPKNYVKHRVKRDFGITKKMFDKHGYTETCSKCKTTKDGSKRKIHNKESKNRFVDKLKQIDENRERVENAHVKTRNQNTKKNYDYNGEEHIPPHSVCSGGSWARFTANSRPKRKPTR